MISSADARSSQLGKVKKLELYKSIPLDFTSILKQGGVCETPPGPNRVKLLIMDRSEKRKKRKKRTQTVTWNAELRSRSKIDLNIIVIVVF